MFFRYTKGCGNCVAVKCERLLDRIYKDMIPYYRCFDKMRQNKLEKCRKKKTFACFFVFIEHGWISRARETLFQDALKSRRYM